MKPLLISAVLARMTPNKLAAVAEKSYREQRANEILEGILQEAQQKAAAKEKAERNEIKRLGYPEYQFVNNARRKAAKERLCREFREWEERRMEEKRKKRQEEKGYL